MATESNYSGTRILDGLPIHQRTITLDNDALLAWGELDTEGYIFIPAQGENKIILPTLLLCHMTWFGDYSNIDAGAQIYIKTGGDIPLKVFDEAENKVSAILASGGPAGNFAYSTFRNTLVADLYNSDIVNKESRFLLINNMLNLEDGNASNVLRSSVQFLIFNIDTGLFE